MKPLHFDAINPFTGKPFTFDDPNLFFGSPSFYLEPGDEGFVPYPDMIRPPKPKKKTFHRRRQAASGSATPNPTEIMSFFKCNVAHNSQGGFTTRPTLGSSVAEAQFFDAVAAACGVPRAQCESVFDAVVDTILSCGAGCAQSTGLRGRLRFRPTSGGSSSTPDGFNNAEQINADVAISLTAEARDTWRAGLTIQSQGEVGKLSPQVDAILSQETGAQDKYAPGTLIDIRGENLRFDKADLAQGVFFRSGNAAEVRATVYGTVTPSSLSVLVPGTLSGPLTVRVAAFINGSVRTFTYMTHITQ